MAEWVARWLLTARMGSRGREFMPCRGGGGAPTTVKFPVLYIYIYRNT